MSTSILTNTGFSLIFPLLVVHLAVTLHFDAAVIGIVFALRSLIEQGGGPVSGLLAERFGYKVTILCGLLIRGAGFALYAFATDLPLLLVAATITGIGGSLFSNLIRATVTRLVPVSGQQSAYATLWAAVWVGEVAGPLLGIVLLPFGFPVVAIVAASVVPLAMIPLLLWLPEVRAVSVVPQGALAPLITALRDADFRRYLVLHGASWTLLFAKGILIPLVATAVAGPQSVGVVLATQAVVGLLLQVPLVRVASHLSTPGTLISVACVLTAVGFAGFAVSATLLAIVVFTVVTGIGEVLLLPNQSFVVSRLGGTGGATYFGLTGFAQGVSSALGSVGGGFIIDLGARAGIGWLPAAILAIGWLLTGAGFLWLDRGTLIARRVQTNREGR